MEDLDILSNRELTLNLQLEDKILFSLHKFRIEKKQREKSEERSNQKLEKLVTKFTYEAVVLLLRVADFPNFVGHVVVDFKFVRDELEAAGVEDVLVLGVVVILHRDRFHRLHRVKEVREWNQDGLFRICSLLRWQVSAGRRVGDQLPQLRPALVQIYSRGACHLSRKLRL